MKRAGLLGATEHIWVRAVADFRYRYAGSMAGVFWHIAWPLAQVLVYSLVASLASGSTLGERSLRVCGGLLPWFAFSDALLLGTDAIGVHAATARFLAQPIASLVAERVLVALFGFAISTSLLVVAAALLGHGPFIQTLVVAAPSGVLLLVFAFGLALALSGLRILLPDVLEALRACLALGVWMMPIVFDESSSLARLLSWNPIYVFIQSYRDAILAAAAPSPAAWLGMTGLAGLSMVCGLLFMRRIESDVRDEL